jgi:predicted metal-binding membrane protein
MLPSAAPAVFLHASVIRRNGETSERVPARAFAFAAGYLIAWIIFSLIATAAQLALTKASLLSPMMELRSRWFGGGLVLVAGAYQFTPWKRKCLECCRSTVDYTGAFRTGVWNGLSCLGCCWALMLLLFVGGVMNLWWLSLLTIFVVIEKLTPSRSQDTRLSGVLLLAAGVWILRHGMMA